MTSGRLTRGQAWRAAATLLLASVVAASPARAQDPAPDPAAQEQPKITSVQRQRFWTGLSVGAGFEKVITTSGRASNPFPYRFLFRTPARSGWAFSPMFGWFGSDIDADSLGSAGTPLGTLKVRPVLVGVRRTWVDEPMSYDVAVAAGPSFNGFSVSDRAVPLLASPGGEVNADANVSVAWRVQASAWHDFTERVALRGSVAFAWNRPEITFTSGTAGRRVTESANSIQLGIGLSYRIF